MEKASEFKIYENLYICLADKEENNLTTIEFMVQENSSEVIINGKIINVNEIEKWIFFELISGLLSNISINSEDLLKPFKRSKSKVPVKKQLQKAVHNLRNQLPDLFSVDKGKKHELILTKRKTQFTDDTTYRLYIPNWEVKGFVNEITSIKGLLSFIRQLLSYNSEIYLKEISRACNRIIDLIRKEYTFYLPLLNDLQLVIKSYELSGLNPKQQGKIFIKLINDLEEKFISEYSPLLNNPVYKNAKAYLGYYYGYNYATSGEDKISQNIQKIFIDKNNHLKAKLLSSAFKYIGSIKAEDNYLFSYAELIGENGFVQQVLNKPIVATTELKFLFGSFTAFSVDRTLCFGKRILVKIDHFIPVSEFKVGYLAPDSKEKLDIYFSGCFEHISDQITKVKLPSNLELDIRSLKMEQKKHIDSEWISNEN
jgi:hypothetical protein